ncbi:MAG TPA: hypothetical protein VF723_12385 [Pyrinomonadaceae bacterium]|jgi:hypothetical protein
MIKASRKLRFPLRLRAGLAACCALMVALPLALAPASALDTPAAAVWQKGFDPEGQFDPKGNAPRGLEEVGSINLYRNTRGSFFRRGSGVNNTRGVIYGFKTLTVTRQRLEFTTVAIRGISYRFTGRFLKGGVFAESYLDTELVVLTGHLTRLRRGQPVAEGDMQFTYFGGT